MGNFREKRGRGRDFSGRGSRPEMHHAVCDECGNDCEVPFKPTGDKPIFCSDCFRNKRGSDSRRSGGRDFGGRDLGRPQMHEAICDKCNKKCEVPFRPTGGKPIYCSDCFDSGDKGRGGKGGNDSKQLEMINDKLDKILKALGASVPKEKTKKVEKTIVVKPEKVAKGKVKKAVSPKKKAVEKTATVKPKKAKAKKK